VTSTTSPAGLQLRFLTDPREFLALTEASLASDPVVSTVVATVAHRAADEVESGIAQPERDWWLVVTDGSGSVVGAAMRTAPFAPQPIFLLPMPDEAAVALARALHDRGEEALGFNGTLPAAQVAAEEMARLTRGTVRNPVRMRLFEVTQVIPPRAAPGRLVPATEDDLDLALDWFDVFEAEADEQAGRPRGSLPAHERDPEEMLRRIRSGSVWFWEDETGTKVHMTAANPPAFGVARIGPVYTPPQQRGHGWASSAVAQVSQLLLDEGARVCLFTDQANPTSNGIYVRLGFRELIDTAVFVVER
jgi:GNAT superfamily N-acetyltransferase